MLMLLGISPELTQASYRVGDSTTNIITPMMPYFPLVVVFCQRYVKSTGIGTVTSMMLPYSIAFLICWTVFLPRLLEDGTPLGIKPLTPTHLNSQLFRTSMQSIQTLNQQFALGDFLKFADAQQMMMGLVKTPLCEARFFLQGAHVSHFHPTHTQRPILFMSEAAVYQPPGRPIRGGIRFAFPGSALTLLSPHSPRPWLGPRFGMASHFNPLREQSTRNNVNAANMMIGN